MPIIRTDEWYVVMFGVFNLPSNNSPLLPEGEQCLAFEIVGDDISLYTAQGVMHYFNRLQVGAAVECLELQERVLPAWMTFLFILIKIAENQPPDYSVCLKNVLNYYYCCCYSRGKSPKASACQTEY